MIDPEREDLSRFACFGRYFGHGRAFIMPVRALHPFPSKAKRFFHDKNHPAMRFGRNLGMLGGFIDSAQA
jgi:hypothetical protein